MTVDGSTVSANVAGLGGGIFNDGVMIVNGSLIAGNSADDEGGDWQTVGCCRSATAPSGATRPLAAAGSSTPRHWHWLPPPSLTTRRAAAAASRISAPPRIILSFPTWWRTIRPSPAIGPTVRVAASRTFLTPDSGSSTPRLGNTAGGAGGGEYNEGASSVQGSTISNNTASDGGGVDNRGTSITGPTARSPSATPRSPTTRLATWVAASRMLLC